MTNEHEYHKCHPPSPSRNVFESEGAGDLIIEASAAYSGAPLGTSRIEGFDWLSQQSLVNLVRSVVIIVNLASSSYQPTWL